MSSTSSDVAAGGSFPFDQAYELKLRSDSPMKLTLVFPELPHNVLRRSRAQYACAFISHALIDLRQFDSHSRLASKFAKACREHTIS